MADSGNRHIWRWSDENPEAIVPLVILIVLILAVPFGHCGPDASQGDPQPVTRFGVVELPAEPAPAEVAPVEAPPEGDPVAPTPTQ